jgi:glycosidase
MNKRNKIILFALIPTLLISLAIILSSQGSGSVQTTAESTPAIPATSTLQVSQARQYGVPFKNIPEHVVLYEVNLRAFSPTGDLKGVISRLDEIKALGVNTIYLMPIFPIGKIKSVNSPYSVQNYYQVNPEFGGLEDLRTLTDEAHKRDMAVILDWVANHTAWDNPWIANQDWYTQEKGKIISPAGTNWQDVADLNYTNPAMRLAMIDALRYWVLEANVDGFRCDAADFIPFDFWQQAIEALQSIPDRKIILLAEGAREDHFSAGFQMNYSWDFYNQLKRVFDGQSATTLYSTHLAEYQGLAAGQNKLRFTTNHDESAWDASPVVLFHGKEGAIAASIITTSMGGVPMLYSGQEVGREDNTPFFSNSPIHWEQNADMLQTYQAVMAFYNQSGALQEGDLRDCSTADVVCFSRSSASEEVLVLVHVRDQALDFAIPAEWQNSAWLDAFTGTPVALETSLQLDGFGYRVLRREKP